MPTWAPITPGSISAVDGSGAVEFLVWFEDHAEAVAIGPKLARGSVEERPVEIKELLEKVEA